MPINRINFPQGVRTVRIVKLEEFFDKTKNFPQSGFVDRPWTVNEIVKDLRVKTNRIDDCSGDLFSGLKDNKAILAHTGCEGEKEGQCIDFKPIRDSILGKIDVNPQEVNGFFLGSEASYPISKKHFGHFVQMANRKDLNIPYSMLQGHKLSESSMMAFDGLENELLVSNGYIDQQLKNTNKSLKTILQEAFEIIKFNPKDRVFKENQLVEENLTNISDKGLDYLF